MSLRLRRRLYAAALLLPLVAFATATGGTWLRCRLTGAALPECCCDDGEARPAPAAPTISEADCCDRVVRAVSPAAAELSSDAQPAREAPVAVLALEQASAATSARGAVRPVPRASLAPPRLRDRLIAKSTLLI
jgi:hypothetical protein